VLLLELSEAVEDLRERTTPEEVLELSRLGSG
jgi:hypothetical protein